jgi:DUF917 family protein
VIKTMTDLDDFVRGSTLYGTGGGGPQTVGKRLLSGSFEEGKDIAWIDIDSLDDDAWICTTFYMGSIAPLTDADREAMRALGLKEKTEPRPLVRAVRELEKEMGVTFSAIVPVELGGINSPAPLDAAAQLGIKVVDGDLAGRAVPEVAQTTPRLGKLPITPMTSADAWGNVAVLRETHGYDAAEAIGKMLSIPAYEPIGLACFAAKVKDMKPWVVRGTMTRNLNTGRAVREARERGDDPAEAFAQAANGTVAFRGTVTTKEWESRGGYMYVDLRVAGSGNFAGQDLRIWAKNENHLTWLNGEQFVTSPDLIQCVYAGDGEPITNADIKEGDDVAVVVVANPLYRSDEGIELLGPHHFGFEDVTYRPVEEILR